MCVCEALIVSTSGTVSATPRPHSRDSHPLSAVVLLRLQAYRAESAADCESICWRWRCEPVNYSENSHPPSTLKGTLGAVDALLHLLSRL